MRLSWNLVLALTSLLDIAASYVHETGRCMMRGQCGKESFFGAQMPCPFNEKAVEPDRELRDSLIKICGSGYATGPVCCDLPQLQSLGENLKKAENLIASCPACKVNFFDFFCTFTCSPDQSTFLNITSTKQSTSKETIANQLSYYVSNYTGTGFFDSCKDVKFSATNGYVMDLIGGGARNYKEFFRFLGHKSLLGSPIQIDFPDLVPSEIKEVHFESKSCSDKDLAYRCACVDCPDSCPELPPIIDGAPCRVGVLSCFTFAVVILYITGLLAFFGGYAAHNNIIKRIRKQPSRLQMAVHHNPIGSGEDNADYPTSGPGKTYFLNTVLNRWFYRLGYTCARYPSAAIGFSLLLAGTLSLGWLRFQIETDPVRLWVSPSSLAAREKHFFDHNFGPFYRTQQMFLVNASSPEQSVVSYENLAWWFNLEQKIVNLKADDISFEDVCFNPTGDACVIQSVTGYWQGDFDDMDEDSWADDLLECATQPINCLPSFQQPLKPNLILGGYEKEDYLSAKAMVSSVVVQNSLNKTIVERAMKWETQLLYMLQDAQRDAAKRGLRLSYSTEISLEQELNRSTNTDAGIVVISYIVMFFYASIALGRFVYKGKRTFVESKFSLGLSGILIVMLSVSASVGLFSFLGVKITLIIAEVIPFLVLAVGVDNIFLLCHELDRVNSRFPEEAIEEQVARTLGRMGPSILLSATCEFVTFALGAFVAMPAVHNFAIYAAGSVLFNAILQVTMFPAALALDLLRKQNNRIDCFPFIKISDRTRHVAPEEAIVSNFIRKVYVPFLLRPKIKVAVLTIFLTISAVAIGLFPKVQLGLDQKIAIPRQSYLIDYFQDLEQYFGTGPPVYFVTRNANVTQREVQRSLCGRFSSCNEFSLANVLEQERKRPKVSFILEPAASWVDDFLLWLNPALDMCCRLKKHDHQEFCTPKSMESDCQPCYENREPAWNITMHGLPEGLEFIKYADAWVAAPTNEDCPLAGQAPYSDALVLDREAVTVHASHYRTFHVPLRTQSDFIESFAAARRIAKTVSADTGLDIFPYAVHYIFFDQYSSIIRLTFGLVFGALACIFTLCAIILGSARIATIVTFTVCMILTDIVGVMALWNISLNAISLVNLVICVGIGVEFCSHIARAYMLPTQCLTHSGLQKGKDRDERVWRAMNNVGASVFTGITLCKFVGVVVLAFTRSKIFEVYYFRMWLALVFIAAFHALVLLPVVLSMFGPEGYVMQAEDFLEEEWLNDTGFVHTNALLARGAGEYDSDEDLY